MMALYCSRSIDSSSTDQTNRQVTKLDVIERDAIDAGFELGGAVDGAVAVVLDAANRLPVVDGAVVVAIVALACLIEMLSWIMTALCSVHCVEQSRQVFRRGLSIHIDAVGVRLSIQIRRSVPA